MVNEVKPMKKLFPMLIAILLLAACGGPQPSPTLPAETTISTAPSDAPTEPATQPPSDPITELVCSMTTEEKVGQLFLARFDGTNAAAHVKQYHLGGYILFGSDFKYETPSSIQAKLTSLQADAPIPLLLAVDEEGGTVTRISRYSAFRGEKFPSPRSLYAAGGEALLLETEAEKSMLLTSLGLNVNMAPVCDITTERSAFMYDRSLGQDPETTGELIAGMVETMAQYRVGSVLKHFPGYGNNDDTHVGVAHDSRSLAELEAFDLIPFRAGIAAGCGAILVSHTVVEALDASLPASLSPLVNDYLRQEMGFDGVTVTDDLAMEAITDVYGAGEAAVLAVLAGNDLLCATEYNVQYEAVLQAVTEGRIPTGRIDEAVTRILRWKQELGLLAFEG